MLYLLTYLVKKTLLDCSQAVVEEYSFWQNNANTMYGYPLRSQLDATKPASMLTVTLLAGKDGCYRAGHSTSLDASAVVRRFQAPDSGALQVGLSTGIIRKSSFAATCFHLVEGLCWNPTRSLPKCHSG